MTNGNRSPPLVVKSWPFPAPACLTRRDAEAHTKTGRRGANT